MIHIIYWQLGQETSLPATFSSHLGSWSEGNWILHTTCSRTLPHGRARKNGAPCAVFLLHAQKWIQRMDAKNGSKHLESLWCSNFSLGTTLVWYLWCFNSVAFHFVPLPNQSPSATSVPPATVSDHEILCRRMHDQFGSSWETQRNAVMVSLGS